MLCVGRGDDKVGSFPIRLLVMLVKLNKLIELKKSAVRHLSDPNAQAERIQVISDRYPYELQVCQPLMGGE